MISKWGTSCVADNAELGKGDSNLVSTLTEKGHKFSVASCILSLSHNLQNLPGMMKKSAILTVPS